MSKYDEYTTVVLHCTPQEMKQLIWARIKHPFYLRYVRIQGGRYEPVVSMNMFQRTVVVKTTKSSAERLMQLCNELPTIHCSFVTVSPEYRKEMEHRA